jgi:hypothetical protein
VSSILHSFEAVIMTSTLCRDRLCLIFGVVVGFLGRSKKMIGKGNIGKQMLGKRYRKFVRMRVYLFKKKKK